MLQCHSFESIESDDDDETYDCCGICHGCNYFEEDVRFTFMLKDGRMAELCCGKIRKLVAAGLLDEKYLEYVND
jgi:hypothetical protein